MPYKGYYFLAKREDAKIRVSKDKDEDLWLEKIE
jgi:hypothetical protein